MPSIDAILGMPHRSATRLRRARVRTTEALLRHAASRVGREQLAQTTGIAADDLLVWCHRAELLAVDGVGGEYAHLLTVVGVMSIEGLKDADPARLVADLAEVNGRREVVRRLPTGVMVARWVERAGSTDSIVEH